MNMKTLRFRPCGNYKIQYREELSVFETDFGRLWAAVGLTALFVWVRSISYAWYGCKRSR